MKAPVAGDSRLVLAPKFGRTMIEQEVTFPDGSIQVFHLWAYVKKPAVLVFPVTLDRKVVAVRQWRPGSNQFEFEFPGGGQENEESPEEAVQSEFLQETGYKIGKIVTLKPESLWIDPPSCNSRCLLYLGLDCEKVGRPRRENTEIMETITMSLEDWYRKCFRGEVTDSKTLAHSILAMPYLDISIKF